MRKPGRHVLPAIGKPPIELPEAGLMVRHSLPEVFRMAQMTEVTKLVDKEISNKLGWNEKQCGIQADVATR